ncbi:protein of unknown function [Fodinibius roseus]|uniref:DUF4345 domain-containing protein n=1 Tax=Fodinibius roseus TaxID=1194090 RepID=A0A1M4TH74_9BACT|nr:DUF4345 family protein [Fodinibius roseus]SHE43745.1 protein of unknown function [Fodinibius roseus]
MKTLNYFFFYTYIGLVVLAGFWGAFLGADVDHQLLLSLDTSTLADETRANVLSQYRFLRAMELGFGLFAIVFRTEIFTVKKFNTLFLTIMLAGVLARTVSLFADGSPSWIFYFFMIYEGVGVIIIFLYSRNRLERSLQ